MPLNHPLKGTEVVGEAKLLVAATNGEKGLIDMKANYASWFSDIAVFIQNDRLRQKEKKKKKKLKESLYATVIR